MEGEKDEIGDSESEDFTSPCDRYNQSRDDSDSSDDDDTDVTIYLSAKQLNKK